jgi:hypothetical protein
MTDFVTKDTVSRLQKRSVRDTNVTFLLKKIPKEIFGGTLKLGWLVHPLHCELSI